MNFSDFVGTMRERPMLELERWCRAWDLDHPVGSSVMAIAPNTDTYVVATISRGVMMVRDSTGDWSATARVYRDNFGTTWDVRIDQIRDV